MAKSFYTIPGSSSNVTAEENNSAYRCPAKSFRPDNCGEDNIMSGEIQEAYSVLGNFHRRITAGRHFCGVKNFSEDTDFELSAEKGEAMYDVCPDCGFSLSVNDGYRNCNICGWWIETGV